MVENIDEPVLTSPVPERKRIDSAKVPFWVTVYHCFVKYKVMIIFTFATGIITLILSIFALVAGMKQGMLQNYEFLNVNSSTILQNAVKITNVGTSSATNVASGTVPSSTAATPTSPFDSIASEIGSMAAGAFETFIGNISSAISNATSSITDGITSGLTSAEGEIIGAITSAIGIMEWYDLHVWGYCEGNYVPSYLDPNASKNTTSCTKFSSLGTSKSTTSPNVTIGTINLDFSALDISNKVAVAGGEVGTLFAAIGAMYIIGAVSGGVLMPLTIVSFIKSQKLYLHIAILVFSSLGFGAMIAASAILTALAVVASGAVNQIGDGLGVEASSGMSFMGLTWAPTVLLGTATTGWAVQLYAGRVWKRRELTRGLKEKAVVI